MLAGWHGWGSFPRVFDDRVHHTAGERAAREAIGRAEQRWPGYLATARRTVLNAHYTDPAIVAAGWRFLRAVGADPQRHVGWEPGAGTGLWMSDELAVPMHGVELDPVSAAVGNHLVPPGSEIVHGSLVDVTVPSSGPGRDGYDVVAGNVPFASFAPHADDNPHELSLHNYALVKAASMVRPGGYLIVVTSRYTLDAAATTTRGLLGELTNLVGAVRLPTGAHAVRAGTEVVSDLLVMHRPHVDGELRGWPEAVPVTVEGVEVVVSAHFVEHPQMVLGGWALGGMRHADDIRVIHTGARDGGYLAELAARLDTIAATAPRLEVEGRSPAAEVAATRRPADLPVGSIVPLGGGRFERWTSQGPTAHVVPRTQQTELEWLCQLRDATRAVLRADANGSPAVDERRRLNERYDRYAGRFGPLNRFTLRAQKSTPVDVEADGEAPAPRRVLPKMGGFRSDPGWWPVAALEIFDEESQTARKAPIMSRPVAATAEYPDRVDDPATAVSVLLARDGQLTAASVADLAGIDGGEVEGWLGDLTFRDPEGEVALTPAALYLSGLVRAKLTAATVAAEADPSYRRNVAALEAVLPRWLGPHEISARLGAPWIPASDVEAFIVEELKLPEVEVVHVAETASWTMTSFGFSAENAYTYAVEGKRTALELVEDLANQRATRITVEDADGRRVLDVESTAAATAKRGELEDLFAGWVWSDPDRADRLAAVYNNRFNAYIEPRWDGSELRLDGLSAEFTPRRHQLDAVARILGDRDRGTLLAHPVGAGKTAVMAIAAIELRRLGISAGPVGIVVPNSMLQQFAREFLQLYPQANVLVADDASFSRDQRREFVARAASGTYDVVLFTHSSFTAVAPSPATIAESTQREIDTHRAALEVVVELDGGQASRKAVKQIETAIAQLEQRLAKATDRAHHDTGGVEFEQLGLGHLMVDEAHLCKNLAFPTRIDGVAPRESARARDLLVKADWLREHRGGGSVTFATATPVTNQLSELWVFQRFLDPDGLARAGVEHFDAWAANFAQSVTAVEIAPSGSGFRTVARFARFTNVPELSRFFRAFADVRSADELGLPRPRVAGGQAEVVAIPADSELKAFMAALVERAGKVKRGRRLEKGDDTVLAVAGDGRVGALDTRLAAKTVGYGPISGPSAKIAAAADRIAAIHHANADNVYTGPDGHPVLEPGATQIVFCDHGVPGNPRREVYADLAEALVERGILRSRVAFVQSAGTHELRARLFAAVREGGCRCWLGRPGRWASVSTCRPDWWRRTS